MEENNKIKQKKKCGRGGRTRDNNKDTRLGEKERSHRVAKKKDEASPGKPCLKMSLVRVLRLIQRLSAVCEGGKRPELKVGDLYDRGQQDARENTGRLERAKVGKTSRTGKANARR